MKLEGSYRVGVSLEELWRSLLDPEVLVAAIPGCEALQVLDDHVYEGTLSIAIGPVRGTFRGKVQLTDLDAPVGYGFELSGHRGPSEFVRGRGRVRLDDGGNGSTTLRYDMDVQVGGRLAAVGNRLLASSATTVVRRSLASFEEKVLERNAAR